MGTVGKKVFWVVGLALLLSSVGCRLWSGQSKSFLPEAKKLNLVVIVIDTLRADHLPFHGYRKNTAPFLERLSANSVVFDRAISTSSSTAPATASIFTAMHPSEHGLITGFVTNERMQERGHNVSFNRIPEKMETMTEVFERAGYRTYAISDNLNICREMGFDKGFEKFETFRYEGAEKVNQTLRDWYPEISAGGQYFLYLHYMDPHKPYHRREPWYEAADDRRQRLVNAYDSEINYVDDKIREMFELYKWDENALVVVLSDHGEEFWEHGDEGHSKTLYREVIHVPFMIYHPQLKEGRRVEQFVRIMDLLPTLAAHLELPDNPLWRGRSLLPAINGEELRDIPIFSELLREEIHTRPSVQAVLKDNWHFIHTVPKEQPEYHELFDMIEDFEQQDNRLAAEGPRAKDLQDLLRLFNEKALELDLETVDIEMDAEMIEQLRTLGYME